MQLQEVITRSVLNFLQIKYFPEIVFKKFFYSEKNKNNLIWKNCYLEIRIEMILQKLYFFERFLYKFELGNFLTGLVIFLVELKIFLIELAIFPVGLATFLI